MIERLALQNFKCFSEQSFDFSKLTVLCGQNGSGKSSVIQSLLIARQMYGTNTGSSRTLTLNGPFGIEFGKVADVFCQNANGRLVEIQICEGNRSSSVKFVADDAILDDLYVTLDMNGDPMPSSLRLDSGFGFTYLSAERFGPRNNQPIQAQPLEKLGVGFRGEYVAEVLAKFERKEIRPQMWHQATNLENRLLSQQLELWMGDWFPGLQIRTELIPDLNLAAIRLRRRRLASEWTKPTNSGFGISHSLPIVLAGLLAIEEGILIVDSPESHLHPRAQSAIGSFLAVLAASGVQVVLETHSDHVLNGIRLAAKRQLIDASDTSILFFGTSEEILESTNQIDRLQLTQDGKLTDWPTGFFDQWESALHELL